MKNIFIDLGCYDGDTIMQFINWRNLISPDNWTFYGFDPNPRFKDTLWKKRTTNWISFENKAAWTYDGDIEFTLRPEHAPLGSTVMQNKVDWGEGDVILVKCFDLAKFLRQFELDFVLIKMDIEGAEYPVLEHLIKTGTDRLIDTLFVEWHENKLEGDYNKEKIIDKLSCEYYLWV